MGLLDGHIAFSTGAARAQGRSHAVRDTAGAPVDEVFLWASIAGMPEEHVAKGVHTICGRLASLLASYDPMAARR